MSFNTDNIRLVFGLKLKQLRLDKGLSLQELANRSGLSVSYINEIEKAKKYPKSDKIIALAEAMDTDYDSLVSLRLNKRLESISQLLSTNFLTELPLEIFGVDAADLLGLLSDAPTKLSAFITTIMEIGRNYNMTVEQFYFAVLRSYQEMHDNYFPDIEQAIEDFLEEYKVPLDKQLDEYLLTNILYKQHGIEVEYFDERSHPEISTLRSVLLPKKGLLLINRHITSDQKAFTLGRELGFIRMKMKNRPLTSSWVEVNSFEQVLNNFKASYFAGGILIRKERLIEKLHDFFNQESWNDGKGLIDMLDTFQATPETLWHRISNVLPKHFGIDQFFFLRFECYEGQQSHMLTKEMHLSRRHNPHRIVGEHYCRRWASLTILDDLSTLQAQGKYVKPIAAAQISRYIDTGSEYFVMALARPLNIIKQMNISVSVGFAMTDEFKKRAKFLSDPSIIVREVNETCERCSAFNCKERVAAPTALQKKRRVEVMKEALMKLNS